VALAVRQVMGAVETQLLPLAQARHSREQSNIMKAGMLFWPKDCLMIMRHAANVL